MPSSRLSPQKNEARARRHRHEFTALYWHFGPHGDQSVHVHSCFTEGCDRVLIGEGRRCDGEPASHRRASLDARGGSS
jgi:hypothetical protein